MKKTFRYLKLVALILSCPAIAAPLATINLHGQLLSSSGTPVSGSRAYTVQFHDAGTGGGGGVDTDSMHWSGYVYDYGAALVVFSQAMLKAGTVTSFQVYCGGPANNTTVDLKKNGSSNLSSVPASFVGNSLQMPSVADPSFTPGDVFEFELDGTTADVQAVTITLVVEYLVEVRLERYET